MSDGGGDTNTAESYVPPIMDRLLFSRWHVLVIAALGITWILDGLEVSIVDIVAPVLKEPISGLRSCGGRPVEQDRGGAIRRPCRTGLYGSHIRCVGYGISASTVHTPRALRKEG